MGAPLVPPNRNLGLITHARRCQLWEDHLRFELEDYETVSTARGPVQGAPAGSRGRTRPR